MATGCLKWLPGVFGQIPRFTGSENGHTYGGSSLEGEFSAHWNALRGFQCVSMGFFIWLYDVFALQQFCWNEFMSLRKAPLYIYIRGEWNEGSVVLEQRRIPGLWDRDSFGCLDRLQ